MLIKYFCIPFHFKGIFGKIDTVRGLLLVKQAKPSVHRKHLCVKTQCLLCTLVLPFLLNFFEGVVDNEDR